MDLNSSSGMPIVLLSASLVAILPMLAGSASLTVPSRTVSSPHAALCVRSISTGGSTLLISTLR